MSDSSSDEIRSIGEITEELARWSKMLCQNLDGGTRALVMGKTSDLRKELKAAEDNARLVKEKMRMFERAHEG